MITNLGKLRKHKEYHDSQNTGLTFLFKCTQLIKIYLSLQRYITTESY